MRTTSIITEPSSIQPVNPAIASAKSRVGAGVKTKHPAMYSVIYF